MSRRSRTASTSTSEHRPKAFFGIALGLLVSITGVAMEVTGGEPVEGVKWSWIVLAGLPIAAWGCSHLARQKGYPSGAAYGLFAFALLIAAVVSRTGTQQIVCVGFLFVGLLPSIVLFLLPRKTKYLRRW